MVGKGVWPELERKGQLYYIDSLFTSQNCAVLCTKVGEMVRLNRRSFLHKGSWFKFKGYAFSQLKKARSQTRVGSRKDMVEEYHYDLKFAMHIFRLLDEVEQIMTYGDIDLMRDKEQLKYIREGNYTLEQIEQMFQDREKQLEALYHSCTCIPNRPDVEKIKGLLIDCLEEHFGSLAEVQRSTDASVASVIRDIESVLDRHRS